MESVKVVLLGLGTVGIGVYESIVSTHQGKLQEALGKRVEIVGVLVKTKKERLIDKQVLVTTDVDELLALPTVDIVFEAIVGIEPACSYIRSFLDRGCHVISANKELLAHKGEELQAYALERSRFLTFEAAVAGGIPLLRTILQLLQVNGIKRLEGILNGTSNFILSKMRTEQADFDEVLAEAQQLGYAEANPESDVSGRDAFYKLMILSGLIYHEQPDWDQVNRVGVTEVRQRDIQLASEFGLRLKLIASLEKGSNSIRAAVKPTFVSNAHPLYNVEGVDNGIVITTDLVGTLMLQGPGAGSKATASAMIEDLVQIIQQQTPRKEVQRHSYHNESDVVTNSEIHLAVLDLQNKTEWRAVTRQLQHEGTEETRYTCIVKELDQQVVAGVLYSGRLPDLPVPYRTYPVSSTGFSQASLHHINTVSIG